MTSEVEVEALIFTKPVSFFQLFVSLYSMYGHTAQGSSIYPSHFGAMHVKKDEYSILHIESSKGGSKSHLKEENCTSKLSA